MSMLMSRLSEEEMKMKTKMKMKMRRREDGMVTGVVI